jgi:hypothetical protein
MANDDELVSEGTEQPSWTALGTVHQERFYAEDGQIVVEGQTYEPVVNVSLGIIGEALYPPLQIVELPSENTGVIQDSPLINLDFFMIPDAFNETFKSRWSAEDLSHGRINPIYNYGGTERQITLSFTLAAFTVAESRSNLRHCQNLARTVYGRYRRLPRGLEDAVGSIAATRFSTIFGGHRNFKVDFGGLIRDETVFINKFAFAADMDAGVFDYSAGDDTDVTHGARGVILPRAVKIEIGFTVIHESLLGFGGQKRVGEPLRWAENRKRDWPHGTGKIDVQEYMKPTTDTIAPLPTIVTQRYTAEEASPDFLSGEQIQSQRAQAVRRRVVSEAATIANAAATAIAASRTPAEIEAALTSIGGRAIEANTTNIGTVIEQALANVEENPPD